MKQFILLIFTLVLSAGTFQLTAQHSDYATARHFQQQYELLKHQLKMAKNSLQLKVLQEDSDSLFSEFQGNKELINQFMYPQTFDALKSQLQTDLHIAMQRLLLIENQRERLFELSNQVLAFKGEINRLNSQTDSLRKEILSSEASEARLSSLVRTYREQLEQRDALMFEMIDSLVISYQGLKTGHTLEEQIPQALATTSDTNPIEWISLIIRQNIEEVGSGNRYLEVEDYLRMYALQVSVEQAWNRVGEQLLNVYSGNNKNQWNTTIEEDLKEWRMQASYNMWKAIRHHLELQEIRLPAFDTPVSFYAGLQNLLDNGISESEEELLTSNSYQNYQKVKDFWNNTFKNEWEYTLKDVDILSAAEIATIDQKLEEWGNKARPIHPMMIAMVSLLIVSVLGFVLSMVKSQNVR